ncbi:MAG: hypothetical protein A2504_11450 [Bdellovibrionales bacterium RIFOXYD12_FULL_39_22]|nr:MAG: hypothetical protein A2385_15965 [Bdellovibrionales bacterium RIFOXYB1_FULL_39_21]OFZ44546.1 MAG: hypothetical protein A2485_06930 [Bdellovibrionales bacterium RIFOXYC12_FULL_39_17]OFZ49812.1 MAG: hypothetical protein A2404_00535 [Bdellovibrionales bacterium RIFOXYC1_FULL_39_130]OFZ76817.1 MAG: hypothetical protein A2560_05335 [Bdellovibrionales bacterium RIFOXYD1_FULL_39_84]OFZ95744.1 MAG: hypothetical protein A2504_11450 [Bdellovibrionales bacterium RIFOXYD12_FULL_39_22]HLE10762.1 pi
MDYKIEKSKNGINTLYLDSPGSTLSSVQIWFRAGSAFESPQDFGMAHFLEHMFFKGTKKRPGAKIAEDIEAFGGEINAFTSFDYTCYYANVPAKKTKNTVEILLDMVSAPLFFEETIPAEREVVLEEYKRSLDSPHQYAFSKLQKLSMSGGYNHPILGTDKTIKKFSRKQLISFRQKYYNLSNMLLIVAGDHKEFASAKNAIDKFKMPEGRAAIYPEFKLKKKGGIDVHAKEVKMSQLTILINAQNYQSAQAVGEDIAINCLGNGDSSRLNKALVLEDNLANITSSSTMYFARGGMHSLKIIFPPENLSKVLERLAGLLAKIKQEGLEKWEVEKIKNQYISSKIFEKESLDSLAFNYGNGLIQFGIPEIEDQFIEKVREASFDSVQTGFLKVWQRDLFISLQIPKDHSLEQAKSELLKFQSEMQKFAKNLGDGSKVDKYKIIKSKYDSEVKVISIKEGVDLLYRQNKLTPTYVLHSYLRGGVSEENLENSGIYNLLSQLLTQGYGKVDRDQIKRELDERSITLSGFSGKNAYGLMMNGLTSNISEALPHFFGSLLTPSIVERDFEQEREFVGRTLLQQTEDPVKQCFNRVAQLMFGDHPYSMNALGNFESIKRITTKSLQDCHQKNLMGNKILFTYCGNQTLDEVLDLLRPYLVQVPSRKKTAANLKKIIPSKQLGDFIPFEREQTHIFMGYPLAALGSKENLYVKMLTTYLSGQSSDLFVDVRDRKGLCYSVQPVYFSALEGGYWGIYMGTGNDKVEAATAAISDILQKLKNNGISRAEFNKIKVIVDGQNQISLQTNEDYANIYSIPLLQDQGIEFYHRNNLAIQKMKYDDFIKLIRAFLSKASIQVVVGKN